MTKLYLLVAVGLLYLVLASARPQFKRRGQNGLNADGAKPNEKPPPCSGDKSKDDEDVETRILNSLLRGLERRGDQSREGGPRVPGGRVPGGRGGPRGSGGPRGPGGPEGPEGPGGPEVPEGPEGENQGGPEEQESEGPGGPEGPEGPGGPEVPEGGNQEGPEGPEEQEPEGEFQERMIRNFLKKRLWKLQKF